MNREAEREQECEYCQGEGWVRVEAGGCPDREVCGECEGDGVINSVELAEREGYICKIGIGVLCGHRPDTCENHACGRTFETATELAAHFLAEHSSERVKEMREALQDITGLLPGELQEAKRIAIEALRRGAGCAV